MDPCPFVRLIVESLALKLPTVNSKPAGAGVHPSSTPCFCTLQLHDSLYSPQTAHLPLPLASSAPSGDLTTNPDSSSLSSSSSSSAAAVFSLDSAALQRLSGKPATLIVSVFAGRTGNTCGFSSGRLLGRVRVSVDLEAAPSLAKVVMSGWVAIGGRGWIHLVVRSEPDPRFVFQFGGEPECSPVVFQVPGNGCGDVASGGRSGCLRQPVFSCRFSADRRRNIRSRSVPAEFSTTHWTNIKGWLGSFGSDRAHHARKGWTVTIHDLSGSPVAAASMVTPFVPSPGGGSDRVSRSNPGAWLILQPAGLSPSATTWKPWGRLEAWRERDGGLGYRFELVADVGAAGVLVAESAISVRRGGMFCIDHPGGFVMGSTVEGEGKASRPVVEVGVQHVTCMGDAALFVALAAAVDLSMDACQLFSQRLRKELCQDQEEYAS